MAELSNSLGQAESQIKTALNEIIANINDLKYTVSGATKTNIHIGDVAAGSHSEYVKIFGYKDSFNTVTARGAMIKLKGFDTEKDIAGGCHQGAKIYHDVEFIQTFEQLKRDSTTSDQYFSRIQLDFFEKITKDRTLGFDNLEIQGPFLEKKAEVKKLDQKELLHSVTYRLESLVECC